MIDDHHHRVEKRSKRMESNKIPNIFKLIKYKSKTSQEISQTIKSNKKHLIEKNPTERLFSRDRMLILVNNQPQKALIYR